MFAYPTAQNLYHQAHSRGQWRRIWSKLTGRSHRLLSLAEVNATCAVHSRANAGLRAVSIKQIRGSEGRSHDFDCDFNPLQSSSQDRWLSIAIARQYDKPLPAVELIQVGDVYFVRDGHHRISVARAMGQQEIDAEVTLWQVKGPLPWDTPAAAPAAAEPMTANLQAYPQIRPNIAAPPECCLVF